MDHDALRRSIDETARSLLVREPYFGHLLVGTVRVVVDGSFPARLVPAGHLVRLEIGAAAWAGLPAGGRAAALKHEMLHLTLKHPLRARDRGSLAVWGLACDLVVNRYLDTTHLPGAFTVADFPGLDLPPDATADAYYDALLPRFEECAGAAGACDSTDGRSMCRWLAGCPAAASHGGWREFADLAAGAASVLERNVDELVRVTARRARTRNWGNLPGGLAEILADLADGTAEIPWRRVLRLFAATSERTYVRSTLTRPSRRYGTVPGIKIRRRTGLVVAVDTSGSVSIDDIAAFFVEIHDMWRRGAKVTVVEADAQVQCEYPYQGRPPEAVSGRCGTSFAPAIARANELRPDGLVYLTDGYAPEPEVAARMPLLWVLTRDGHDPADAGHLPGRRVKLTQS